MIELTVGLPLFRAGNTAWLALESLCRQKDIDFQWELLILEENTDEKLGFNGLLDYDDRLEEVGCINIDYVPLDRWWMLSDKWKSMGGMADPNSKAFVLCGADDWNGSLRLKEAYDLIVHYGSDWVQYMKGYYYDMIDRQMYLFDCTNNFRGMLNPMVGKAIATKWMRNLDIEPTDRKVDMWLMTNLLKQHPAAIYTINDSENWKENLYTYGANVIGYQEPYKLRSGEMCTTSRQEIMRMYEHPFYKTDVQLVDVVGTPVAELIHDIPLLDESERIGGGWKP